MSKQIKMQDIQDGQLFILAGVGVLRKTHPIQGTTRDGKVHVIYPNESVSLLKKKEK